MPFLTHLIKPNTNYSNSNSHNNRHSDNNNYPNNNYHHRRGPLANKVSILTLMGSIWSHYRPQIVHIIVILAIVGNKIGYFQQLPRVQVVPLLGNEQV